MVRSHRIAASVVASLTLVPVPRRRPACCAEPPGGQRKLSYYGSYASDRFRGGIGNRVGVDESRSKELPGSGVVRAAVFSETHDRLRDWATAENWRQATEIHKAAYFTRTENPLQEAVVEHIRQHYKSSAHVSREPVQMALFRLEDVSSFKERCQKATVSRLPEIVHGVFDEKSEKCIVDFANKRLGGGWLSYGCVQEEIMFIQRFDYGAICARSLLEMPDPSAEPLASPFSMHPNEAWLLRGAPSYAELGWYGRPPKNAMERVKLLDPAEDQATMPTVVAIDAIKANFETYEREHLEMMLVKAYTGFVAAREDPDLGGQDLIATGSWGCGAFYNSEPVMFAVQVLAANAAGVRLTYHVLGDGRALAPAVALLEEALVKKLSVAETLDLVAARCAEDPDWRTKFKPLKSSM